MRKTTKRFTALAFSVVFVAGLTACDDAEPEVKEEVSASEQEAQESVDATQSAYKETYPTVRAHLIDEYGITETAALCDEQEEKAADLESDFDGFIKALMDEAGIDVEGESRMDSPEFMGAFDATDDALYDICNP